jgi:hypothetical protein
MKREFTETVLEYHLKKFILNFKPSQLIIITKMNLQKTELKK